MNVSAFVGVTSNVTATKVCLWVIQLIHDLRVSYSHAAFHAQQKNVCSCDQCTESTIASLSTPHYLPLFIHYLFSYIFHFRGPHQIHSLFIAFQFLLICFAQRWISVAGLSSALHRKHAPDEINIWSTGWTLHGHFANRHRIAAVVAYSAHEKATEWKWGGQRW